MSHLKHEVKLADNVKVLKLWSKMYLEFLTKPNKLHHSSEFNNNLIKFKALHISA